MRRRSRPRSPACTCISRRPGRACRRTATSSSAPPPRAPTGTRRRCSCRRRAAPAPSGDSAGGTAGGASGNGGGERFRRRLERRFERRGAPGGSSGGGGNGGGSSAGSFHPGKMHKPTKQHGDLMSFPGAVFPVDGPVWYQDDFGAPRAVGGGHTGNDIFARRGTPLVAVQDGTIAELRYRSLGGNSFHLVNAEGDYFYYAHLMRYAADIQEGSAVTGRAGPRLRGQHRQRHHHAAAPALRDPSRRGRAGRPVPLSREVARATPPRRPTTPPACGVARGLAGGRAARDLLGGGGRASRAGHPAPAQARPRATAAASGWPC